jgi:hypothetical protein
MSSESLLSSIIPFAGSGVAGFFMGMFLRRVLKFLVIIIGSFLGAVFLVSSSHILGTLGIPATSGLAIGLVAGQAKS